MTQSEISSRIEKVVTEIREYFGVTKDQYRIMDNQKFEAKMMAIRLCRENGIKQTTVIRVLI